MLRFEMHASQIQGCVVEQRVEKNRKIAELPLCRTPHFFLPVAGATASTHFAYPRRDGSGLVDLGARFCAEVVYPSKDGHPSRH